MSSYRQAFSQPGYQEPPHCRIALEAFVLSPVDWRPCSVALHQVHWQVGCQIWMRYSIDTTPGWRNTHAAHEDCAARMRSVRPESGFRMMATNPTCPACVLFGYAFERRVPRLLVGGHLNAPDSSIADRMGRSGCAANAAWKTSTTSGWRTSPKP